MFNYNPGVNDNSGQIYAQLATQGAQAIGAGLAQGGQDFGKELERHKLEAEQALGAAQSLGIYANMKSPITQEAYVPPEVIQNLQGMAKSNPAGALFAAASLHQIIPQFIQGDRYQALMNWRDANLATKSNNASDATTTVPNFQ